jgi:hypothetical protein
MDTEEQIARHDFPPGVRVSSYPEGPGTTVFRIVQRSLQQTRGLEIGLTAEATEMYGEGPGVNTVLDQLCRHLEEGLPVVEPGQEYPRLTFQGD